MSVASDLVSALAAYGAAHPQELGRVLRHGRKYRAARARDDVNLFIEHVLRDEKTGGRVFQSGMHRAWHRLADDHRRLDLWSHTEAGKSSQMSIGRVLHALGRDPSTRVAIVSNTHEQASKLIRALATYIETSDPLHEVFPGLRKSSRKSDLWNSGAITVERSVIAKEPSVQAFGVHGNVTGARLDLLILDDVLDYENCRTENLRKDLWDWYHATLAGRLTDEARVICIGTAYHPEDLMHLFARNPAWKAVRYPVVDEAGFSRWPERWPPERIARRREELGPLEYPRQMLCVARDDASSRVKREWIQRALDRGAEKSMTYALSAVPLGYRTYTGVDLAVQKSAAADLTAFVTIVVGPDGTREILDVDSARISGPEIVGRIVDLHHRYQSIVYVESNGAQDFINQFIRDQTAVPVRSFVTGKNKLDPAFGVESLVAEMDAGKWIIPCQGGLKPEAAALVADLLHYDPRDHTGDRLMACWIAREAARLGERPVPVAEVGRFNVMGR